ncbi:MAG: hypothetical protein HZC24_00710 [Rhodocyclales bacterium]|nr:hypothetical protein [Rhodocyclales bacterium]
MLLAGAVFAQADVGLVNQVAGNVTYTSGKDAAAHGILAYGRVRHGDRIALPAGAELKISYFSGNRQEVWKGPSAFVATTNGGELLKGNQPEVSRLPGVVAQKLARIPELMGTSRVGGIVVRSLTVKPDAAQREKAVAEAMSAYETLRAKSAESDVTPELFLIGVLIDNEMYAEVKWVAQEMIKRQPDNEELRKFAAWAQAQKSTP